MVWKMATIKTTFEKIGFSFYLGTPWENHKLPPMEQNTWYRVWDYQVNNGRSEASSPKKEKQYLQCIHAYYFGELTF